MRPRKSHLILSVKFPRSEEVTQKLDDTDIETLPYTRWGTYRVRLQQADMTQSGDLIRELITMAYQDAGH